MTAPINQDIAERDKIIESSISYAVTDGQNQIHDLLSNKATVQEVNLRANASVSHHSRLIKNALAQREQALIEYLSDLYGLPVAEVKRNVQLWQSKEP